MHKCCKCHGVPLKPQNRSSYWTDDKKQQLSQAVLNSENYKTGISNRNTAGENNGMFGKKASAATKQKMSKSRTGKIGTKSTAWKGGKCSVVSRVKGIIHGRYNWYGRVYQRDGWKCVKCSSTKKIDAHHIDPVNQIVKRLCEGRTFENDDAKVTWLIEQPEIIDHNLTNGITLCRECHKKEHRSWGSHNCI